MMTELGAAIKGQHILRVLHLDFRLRRTLMWLLRDYKQHAMPSRSGARRAQRLADASVKTLYNFMAKAWKEFYPDGAVYEAGAKNKRPPIVLLIERPHMTVGIAGRPSGPVLANLWVTTGKQGPAARIMGMRWMKQLLGAE